MLDVIAVINELESLQNNCDGSTKIIINEAIIKLRTTPVIHTHCLRCGKLLTSPESKQIGYGRICEEKIFSELHHKCIPVEF